METISKKLFLISDKKKQLRDEQRTPLSIPMLDTYVKRIFKQIIVFYTNERYKIGIAMSKNSLWSSVD